MASVAAIGRGCASPSIARPSATICRFPRAGDFFQIAPAEPIEGSRYLIFEAVGSDEVVVEDIEINYRGSWVRHRIEARQEPR